MKDNFISLDEVSAVVDDPIKFKLKLGIGEDAFASLKLTNTLKTIWDVKGAATAGGVLASSTTVATTFFGGGGGILSALGIGAAAATPVGWIVAAAVATGGAYYGVMKLSSGYSESRVETIPKFINTPIDLLGATLFDMVGGIALKVVSLSDSSDSVEHSESQALTDYFSEEWGLSRDYTGAAIPIILSQVKDRRLKEMVKSLADFQMDNPDCSPSAMRKDISLILDEIAHADGEIDEIEELAIEVVQKDLATHLSVQKQALKIAQKSGSAAAEVSSKVAEQAGRQAGALFGRLSDRFNTKK